MSLCSLNWIWDWVWIHISSVRVRWREEIQTQLCVSHRNVLIRIHSNPIQLVMHSFRKLIPKSPPSICLIDDSSTTDSAIPSIVDLYSIIAANLLSLWIVTAVKAWLSHSLIEIDQWLLLFTFFLKIYLYHNLWSIYRIMCQIVFRKTKLY